MNVPSLQKQVAIIATTILAWLAFGGLPLHAYSPTHPDVQAMVGKARQFLAKAETRTMGEAALVGLALIKSGSTDADPKVQQAVATIQGALQSKQINLPINYHVVISIIFLTENDPVKYRTELEQLLTILLQRQEGHGGWSYWPGEGNHGRDEGDSSQTQLATLALWGAKRAGFTVPQEACEKLANFWIRSQTPQGAWGYQSRPASLGQKVEQSEVRPSIAVAGLGSCYVIGELFGMAKGKDQSKSSISSALQQVQQRDSAGLYFTAKSLDLDLLRQAMSAGNSFIEQNHRGYLQASGGHPWSVIYYIYGMERFRSFQELYQGKPVENASWYNEGVELFKQSQNADGSWKFGNGEHGVHVHTAFSVLFLMRTTKKSIERQFGASLVRGGRGLPTDIGKVVVDEATGAVVNPEAASTVEQLMSILDDPKNANFDSVASDPSKLVEAIARPSEESDKAAQAQRIQRLKDMVSKGSYEQRLLAVKALSRTGDMNHVPLLLYALTDPDPRVVDAADTGLRFLSRKLGGFGSPDPSKPEQMEKLRLQWKDWYLAIRPEAELLE